MRSPAALTVPEASDDDRIVALEDERRMLAPYASTAGLVKLKNRLKDIDRALHRLRGLPFDEGLP